MTAPLFRLFRARLPRASVLALTLTVPLTLAGCDGVGSDGDLIVAGVNLTRLYAPPTAAEIQAVLDEWEERAPEPVDPEVVAQTTVDGARVIIVRHTMTDLDGSTFLHYGAVRIPDGAANAPVLVYHHGGDSGFSVTEVLGVLVQLPTVFSQTIQVIPVYRSEDITASGLVGLEPKYRAGGGESPLDYDVDDAIALTEAVVRLFDAETDPTRIGAMGFSRGASVALLMAARDARMRAVTEIAGPTDFFDASSQPLATKLLLGDEEAINGVGGRFALEHVLTPLAPDGRYDPETDYARARLEVVRRSSALFTSRLPALQVHHHYLDGTVPYEQAVALDAARRAVPNRGAYEFYLYGDPPLPGVERPQGYHGIAAMPGGYERIDEFLAEHLLGRSFASADGF